MTKFKTQLVICRGLPASGKTTYSLEWLTWGSRRARVNRDDIRANVMGMNPSDGVLDWIGEGTVTTVQRATVTALIKAGYDVIIDDTNLKASVSRAWADLAHELGAEFECVDFLDVTLETCVNRATLRKLEGGRDVPETVIRGMHTRYGLSRGLPPVVRTQDVDAAQGYVYEPDTTLPAAYLFDIDGTLAIMGDRGPFDWHKVHEDTGNAWVMDICESLCDKNIIIMSGRDESCREGTLEWLEDHSVTFDHLFMRPEGDTRKDSIVKAELFREHVAPNFNVLAVFDDRESVVDMWREIGLGCAQVAPGKF